MFVFHLTHDDRTVLSEDAATATKKQMKKGLVTLPQGGGIRKPLPEFGMYTDLVMFLLNNQATVEPILYTMMYSITWKDTRTCTQMSKILSKLTPLLIQDAKFHPFLSRELLMHALQVSNLFIVSCIKN